MSEASIIKIFDPPYEKHFGDRGYYLHAIHDMTDSTDKAPRLSASYVGYVVEFGDVFENKPDQESDEQEDTDNNLPYICLPLDDKWAEPEDYEDYKHIGLHSVVRLIIYHAGKRITDNYRFMDPDNLDIADADPDPSTADVPINSAQSIEDKRIKLVKSGNDMVRILLKMQSGSEAEEPEAA